MSVDRAGSHGRSLESKLQEGGALFRLQSRDALTSLASSSSTTSLPRSKGTDGQTDTERLRLNSQGVPKENIKEVQLSFTTCPGASPNTPRPRACAVISFWRFYGHSRMLIS